MVRMEGAHRSTHIMAWCPVVTGRSPGAARIFQNYVAQKRSSPLLFHRHCIRRGIQLMHETVFERVEEGKHAQRRWL